MLGTIATVVVDGKTFTGIVYHVRENGWVCVESPNGHIASGPILGTETGLERSLSDTLTSS